MAAFCEYIGFGGVCMQPQAEQPHDAELLLLYCETHLALVRRERAKRQRVPQLHTGVRHPLVVSRSRSEPYLQRSTSRGGGADRDSSPRITVVDGSDESDNDHVHEVTDSVAAHWSISSPRRAPDDSRRATMDVFERRTHSSHTDPRADKPQPTEGAQRKRVRVKKIVIPPRFEVLDDGEAATPPDDWYVRLAERVPGEPGDPDDDEYMEVDGPDATTAMPQSGTHVSTFDWWLR